MALLVFAGSRHSVQDVVASFGSSCSICWDFVALGTMSFTWMRWNRRATSTSKGNTARSKNHGAVHYFRKVMAEFGLHDNYSLLCDGGARHIGLSRNEVVDRVRKPMG